MSGKLQCCHRNQQKNVLQEGRFGQLNHVCRIMIAEEGSLDLPTRGSPITLIWSVYRENRNTIERYCNIRNLNCNSIAKLEIELQHQFVVNER